MQKCDMAVNTNNTGTSTMSASGLSGHAGNLGHLQYAVNEPEELDAELEGIDITGVPENNKYNEDIASLTSAGRYSIYYDRMMYYHCWSYLLLRLYHLYSLLSFISIGILIDPEWHHGLNNQNIDKQIRPFRWLVDFG